MLFRLGATSGDAGDDEPVPMLQRAALGRVRDEPDPRRKLALYGDFVAEVPPRQAGVELVRRRFGGAPPDQTSG